MTKAIFKTAGIVLFAAPKGQGDALVKALSEADIECIQVNTSESCLSIVKSVFPDALLIDLDLPQEDCQEITDGLGEVFEGCSIPVVLLALPADLEKIKSQFLSIASDIVFKPVRYDELITRLALIKARGPNRAPDRVDDAGHKMVLSARKACHELNQPLQYILGSVQLAILDISPENSLYEVMNGLRQQSERMAQITFDLMRLLRLMG